MLDLYRQHRKLFLTGIVSSLMFLVCFCAATALAQTAPAVPTDPSGLTAFIKIAFHAVKDGAWGTVAAAVLVVLVGIIRVYGAKIRAALADTNPLDKALAFLFGTKIGGWVLNFATTVAAGLSGALLAGEKIDWSLAKPVLVVSLSGAALWELAKDLYDWWTSRKAPALPAPAPADPPKP